MWRAGNALENHVGSGCGETGCLDTLAARVPVPHMVFSQSARLTSSCSTAKNNHGPGERKCTRRVRGRQWFWQSHWLGKAPGEEVERKDMAPCNPSLVPWFQRLHSSERSPNPLRLSTKNIPAAQRSFPSRGCVIRPCYLRGPAFIPAERCVRTGKAGGKDGVRDPGTDPWQVVPLQASCHPGHRSLMCFLCSASSSLWVRGNPHLPGSFRAPRDTGATPRQAQQVPELSRFPGRCPPAPSILIPRSELPGQPGERCRRSRLVQRGRPGLEGGDGCFARGNGWVFRGG